ncbi:MAG: chaperone NapD [Gammaproteobacteria bacterium]|nr:chaperone NapD [Gammaproteobacteria bacterium]MCB1922303.1 chaperone NapD [Gammaproteobacteria bacterium]
MNEYHVCGVLLMSRPEHVASVSAKIATMPGVELHANDGGRMVVTVEGAAYADCADTMNTLATLDGVASSSLVYHQIDNESQPEESQQ